MEVPPPPQPQKAQPQPSERHRAAPQQVCFLFLDTAEGHYNLTRENPDFGSCYWISKSRAAGAECQTHAIVFCCSPLEQLGGLYFGPGCPEKQSELHQPPALIILDPDQVCNPKGSSARIVLFLQPHQNPCWNSGTDLTVRLGEMLMKHQVYSP